MQLKMFAFVWFAALAVAPVTVAASDGCCEEPKACCEMTARPCCAEPSAIDVLMAMDANATRPAEPSAVDVLIAMDPKATVPAEPSAVELLMAMDPRAILPGQTEAAPARQMTAVWFHRPVWVGDVVLMGKYVIEHDTGRQARGEPCTHIYAASDMKKPVVAFHCTHLHGNRAEQATVMLQSLPDGTRKLLQFQFAGESDAHGFPTDR